MSVRVKVGVVVPYSAVCCRSFSRGGGRTQSVLSYKEREGKQAQIGPVLVPGVRWGKGRKRGGGGGGGRGGGGGGMLGCESGRSKPASQRARRRQELTGLE